MIDRDDDRPAYRQIADVLRARIAAGALRPGFPLPGENSLMAEYGVSRTTARRAVEVLREAGVVYTRPGFGTYVRDAERRRHVVRLSAGTVVGRAASRRQGRRFNVPVGAPMLEITRGQVVIVVPADRVLVEIGPAAAGS